MQKKKPALTHPYDKNYFNPPAPALEVSLSTPDPTIHNQNVKLLGLLDSGADMTVIPGWIVQQLQLRYVDEVLAGGYNEAPKRTFVYSVKILLANLGDYTMKVIASEKDQHVLIGRDILNKWSLFLKGRDEIFEVLN